MLSKNGDTTNPSSVIATKEGVINPTIVTLPIKATVSLRICNKVGTLRLTVVFISTVQAVKTTLHENGYTEIQNAVGKQVYTCAPSAFCVTPTEGKFENHKKNRVAPMLACGQLNCRTIKRRLAFISN